MIFIWLQLPKPSWRRRIFRLLAVSALLSYLVIGFVNWYQDCAGPFGICH